MTDETARTALLRRGFALEYATLGWNVVGIAVLAVAAISARSVALAGFGLDSLIEIGASTVVIWELSGTGQARQRQRGESEQFSREPKLPETRKKSGKPPVDAAVAVFEKTILPDRRIVESSDRPEPGGHSSEGR